MHTVFLATLLMLGGCNPLAVPIADGNKSGRERPSSSIDTALPGDDKVTVSEAIETFPQENTTEAVITPEFINKIEF